MSRGLLKTLAPPPPTHTHPLGGGVGVVRKRAGLPWKWFFPQNTRWNAASETTRGTCPHQTFSSGVQPLIFNRSSSV